MTVSTKSDMKPSVTSSGYSRRQWTIFVIMALSNLFSSVKVSLQAPFYPHEAEKKGATASEYGLVFGIFELTTFIMSPIYGILMSRINPRSMFKIGVFVAGCASIIFGLLDRIQGKNAFIAMSLAIRILESLGATAVNTSSFTILALEFGNSGVASVFASLETFFGLGLTLGPTIGGALYELGGFTLPFAVMGSCLLTCATIAMIFLPNDVQEDIQDKIPGGGFRIFSLIKIPGVALSCFGTFVTALAIGFLSGVLEPHVRPFGLSPFWTGNLFLLNGLIYAFSAPFWGRLCDRVSDPKLVTIAGAWILIAAFSFMGPFPLLPFKPTITCAAIGIALFGLGTGASVPSSFISGLLEARLNGFPDNVSTYGLISGLWVSMFSLGAFVGPTAGGILYDLVGFRYGSLLVIISQSVLIMAILAFMKFRKRGAKEEDNTALLNEIDQGNSKSYRSK